MRILLPQLEHPDLRVEFGASEIEVLQEYKDSGVGRESKLLGRGVLTINEVRCQSNLPTYLGEIRPLIESKGQGLRNERLVRSGNHKETMAGMDQTNLTPITLVRRMWTPWRRKGVTQAGNQPAV